MLAVNEEVLVHQIFTPDSVGEGERVDYWIAVTRRVFWPFRTGMPQSSLSGASVNWDVCSALELATVTAGRHIVDHSAAHAAASPGDTVCLALQVAGQGVVRQDGRDAVLATGHASFFDPRRPYAMSFDDAFSLAVFSLPRELINTVCRQTERITARALGPGEHVAASALSYLSCVAAVSGQVGLADESLSNGALAIAGTLVRELVGAADERPAGDGLLEKAIAFIDLNLHDVGLSPKDVAAACHVSVRQLYRVFETTGHSVADTIRHRRLGRAQALLESLGPGVPVLWVGARVGFASAEQFTRAFRQTRGLPPAAWRAARRTARVTGEPTDPGCPDGPASEPDEPSLGSDAAGLPMMA